MKTIEVNLKDETATQAFAQQFARLLVTKHSSSDNQETSIQPLSSYWIALIGDLGAGKTTFTRYVLQELGHEGSVKSPTYTLVEPYEISSLMFYHFDLYRLSDPEELEYLGIRDYQTDNVIAFVEWPSKGEGFLPAMDLTINIDFAGEGRKLTLTAKTVKGVKLLMSLDAIQ